MKEFADVCLGDSSQMTLLHVGRNEAAPNSKPSSATISTMRSASGGSVLDVGRVLRLASLAFLACAGGGAVNAAADYLVYVSNERSGDVTIIDGATQRVTGTFFTENLLRRALQK